MALLVPNNSMRISDLRFYGFRRLGILPFIDFRVSIEFDSPGRIKCFHFSIRACYYKKCEYSRMVKLLADNKNQHLRKANLKSQFSELGTSADYGVTMGGR